MFNETQEGRTHFENDGCGEKEHNSMKQEQRKIEKELFEMVYQWGRAGIVTDELCNAFQDKLKELREYKLLTCA